LLALFCAGCGAVHFTEPDPPALFRSKADYSSAAVAEPVVWLPVLDLFAESPEACDGARAWTLQSIRDAMTAAPAPHLELAGADLSPSCAQDPARALDAAGLQGEIENAVAAFPAGHVRVVIVYANNVELAVPDSVATPLVTLRQSGFLWTVARAPVSSQIAADQVIDWTFAADPALAQSLATAASHELPLQSDSIDLSPQPIFAGGDLSRARSVKLCAADGLVTVANMAQDGSATEVNPGQPPVFEVEFAPRYALPRSQFQPQHASVEVEGCSDHCDRYVTFQPGDLRRWDTTRGCLLGAR
jgi:hypothetical protein